MTHLLSNRIAKDSLPELPAFLPIGMRIVVSAFLEIVKLILTRILEIKVENVTILMTQTNPIPQVAAQVGGEWFSIHQWA